MQANAVARPAAQSVCPHMTTDVDQKVVPRPSVRAANEAPRLLLPSERAARKTMTQANAPGIPTEPTVAMYDTVATATLLFGSKAFASVIL